MSSPSINLIRSLVGRYELGYYMNPGGTEFFCPAHPSIPHCQIGEMGDEEDADKLRLWCEEHKDELTTPKPSTYIWYSEGEWPVRAINGRYFRRCTLEYETNTDGLVEKTKLEIVDIEEYDGGWKLISAAGDRTIWLKPDTPEDRGEWEKILFRDHP